MNKIVLDETANKYLKALARIENTLRAYCAKSSCRHCEDKCDTGSCMDLLYGFVYQDLLKRTLEKNAEDMLKCTKGVEL